MRNTTPLQWIEEAEERRVLAQAGLEPRPRAHWSNIARDLAAQWLSRLGAWLAWHPLSAPAVQLRPVPIYRPPVRPERYSDDGDSCCDW